MKTKYMSDIISEFYLGQAKSVYEIHGDVGLGQIDD